uniref:Uncharacterized protein n=1 Tax=Mucochytrium quahogii TaxID=96639 RepID=A0A7S2RYT4_9STRA|mmetsp:Transcript_8877/g.14423  ORF Transcript_8877/g.14423 Transcript_8877/m.14423 type:complete len:101 (+) Transcript_8877:244-546(+)
MFSSRVLRCKAQGGSRVKAGPEKTAGLDLNDWKGTAKRFFNRDEGAELRKLHSQYSKQYNKMYGYTVATFAVAAGMAYMFRQMLPSEKEMEQRRNSKANN